MFMVIGTSARENICCLHIRTVIGTINSEPNPNCVQVNHGTDVKSTRIIAEQQTPATRSRSIC